MNAALGLYDRDQSEKEYWVWESDGSEANFTHWNAYANKLGTYESNGCVNLNLNDVDSEWIDYYNSKIGPPKTTMYWYNQNCYSTRPVLCQRMVG